MRRRGRQPCNYCRIPSLAPYPILSDNLGTPRVVLDSISGDRRWTWEPKEAFGFQAPNENPDSSIAGAFVFDARFPGQFLDEETGLFHNGFRDYDAKNGRHVESDPLGLEAGWNTYAYVGNSPTVAVDLLGLSQRDVQKIVSTTSASVQKMNTANQRLNFGGYSFGILTAGANNVEHTSARIGNYLYEKLGLKPEFNRYKMCVEQSAVVWADLSTLGKSGQLDDTWEFEYGTGGRHTWVEATSSNPSDPKLIIDPWVNRVKVVQKGQVFPWWSIYGK